MGYYFQMAFHSLKRSPGLTLLMVLSVGLGVALAMSAWTLVHLMSANPIPEKSKVLYFPSIDMWGPTAKVGVSPDGEPPDLFDYSSVADLLRDHRARYQSAAYWLNPTVVPSNADVHPLTISSFAVSGKFFPMLDVPFQYGNGWSQGDDQALAQVVVISKQINERLFRGENSVGKTLEVNGRTYRVVGVTSDWNPQPTFYDIPAFGGFMLEPTGMFIPFNTAIDAKMAGMGTKNCTIPPPESGFIGLLHSSCVWISYLVQIDDPAAAKTYFNYLAGFSRTRYGWAPKVRLRNVDEWLNYMQVVPSGIQILRYVGAGLLVICLVNTIGLLLAKFLRRGNEIGMRRALGAQRSSIYMQFLSEGAVIGLLGGVVGIGFTLLAMEWLRARFPQGWHALTELDVSALAMTLLVSIVATLLAALYPTWRAANIQPAWQIKSN